MAADEYLISSVEVTEVGGHDRVKVWNRGGLAGELIVTKGDGASIADRLVEEGGTIRYARRSDTLPRARLAHWSSDGE